MISLSVPQMPAFLNTPNSRRTAMTSINSKSTLAMGRLTFDIAMPDDFPMEPYNAIFDYCRPIMSTKPAVVSKWLEFCAAWKALSHRYRAMAHHDEAFSHAITWKNKDDRYVEERELCNFFFTGMSIFDTFAYGIHFIAAVERPSDFPVRDRYAITLGNTVNCFEKVFAKHEITRSFKRFLRDHNYHQWRKIKNVLSCRGASNREIHLSVSTVPTNHNNLWRVDNIVLDPETTSLRRSWLSKWLGNLLFATKQFAEDVF